MSGASRREHRFRVFGRAMAVVESAGGREVVLLGADGKRRPAGVPVPPELSATELATWLGDVFHEAATPRYPDVETLD